eukprot:TRINITY_DN22577_c0_g1_i1.p1 TRINITY_DN22577_c0_g1~~TRINITY_DN22577_c0_g1_i1.p1  ORF type:complete len:364 (+),score=58.35 TRINITY_DN22577_c0_g1_i1:44-1135(+)
MKETILILFAAIAGLCEAGEKSIWELTACAGETTKLKIFDLRVGLLPSGPVYVAELGTDPVIRIFCIDYIETPANGECTRSLPRLCRDGIEEENFCEDLPEYTYSSAKEITRGAADGPNIRWLLMWQPNGKPASCYPRDISMYVTYQVEAPLEGSTALSIIAIITLTVMVIALGAFGLTRLLRKGKQQREARQRSMHPKNETAELEADITDVVCCPQCGNYQQKEWEGDDPLAKMRCIGCNKNSAGWSKLLVEGVDPATGQPDHMTAMPPLYPERATGGRTRGWTSAEIAARHDPALQAALGGPNYENENPLQNAFPPDASTPPTQGLAPKTVTWSSRGDVAHNPVDPDPVFETPTLDTYKFG